MFDFFWTTPRLVNSPNLDPAISRLPTVSVATSPRVFRARNAKVSGCAGMPKSEWDCHFMGNGSYIATNPCKVLQDTVHHAIAASVGH
jgi:hypothetical protein